MVVPIRLNRQIIGFLSLDSAMTNHFTEDHARWLQTFANQASIAINNARLLEEIRSHADELQQHVEARTAELRHERAQLRAILDAMKDGVVYYDLDDLPQYINKAMIDIMHSSEAEWMRLRAGSQIYAMTRDEHRQLMERIDRGLQSFGIWRSDVLMLRADGTTFDANLTYTEVQDENNDRMGVVAVIRDISQVKQLEEQKKRFIADAAHELRTPIANLKVRLFLMRRQPEKFEEHIEVATKAADWMQRLIDNLFDIARFERGIIELKRESVFLQQFLIDVVRFHEPEAERLGVRFAFDMPAEAVTAQLDPYRMTQVISNLVGNALHYTPENGTVTLEMALDMPTNEVVIRVRDTGIGIEPEHLPHVFQPFYRGGTVDNRGAGLGLSISQDIVRLHGGSISVESEYGAGTEFIVRLPVTELQVDI
jgi:PAS domain S-box-containing protein